MITEKYWFHDFKILTQNYQNIIPNVDMTYPEKVNSLIRMTIIIGLVLSLIYYNHLFLYIPVITMLFTYILFLFREKELHNLIKNLNNNSNNLTNNSNNLTSDNNNLTSDNNNLTSDGNTFKNIKEKNKDLFYKFENYLDDINYVQPNTENPFMNPMPFDSRSRNPATNTVNNPVKQSEIEVLFDFGTYRDVNDIFDKNNGKRQFFTMPSTTYPNNQGGFANWLYKTPPTCKEGNGAQCVANNYTPLNRNLLTPGVGSKP